LVGMNATSRRETNSRIPKFSSYEEEAEFWDTHDTEEFADELEEVEVKFHPPLSGQGDWPEGGPTFPPRVPDNAGRRRAQEQPAIAVGIVHCCHIFRGRHYVRLL